MRPALPVALLLVALIDCLASRLYAHPASCTAGGCGCVQLGLPPENERVKTNQREEIVADWRAQDGMTEGGLDVKVIRRVVDGLGPPASQSRISGKLRADCDALAKAKVAAEDPRWAALYRAACEKRCELRLEPYREALRRIVFTKHYDMGGTHYAYTEGLSDAQHEGHFVPGASLCLLEMDGLYANFRTLLDDPGGVIRDPDVSHHGRRIVFAWKKSHRKDDYHLYEMDVQTGKLRQLTSGLGFADYEPAYMPDGSAQRELYGNNSCFPTTILHARSIPGTGKYVCIFTGHHSRQRGWLGIIDPRKGRQENQGVQLIAPLRQTPAVVVDQYGQAGDQFQYPYPLGETAFLVGFATPPPGVEIFSSGSERFGIYFMTIDGQRELLYKDNNISCNQPVPLRPRPVSRQRANLVDYHQKSGTVYLHDVYVGPGLQGVKRGTIKRLRVVALEFRPTARGVPPHPHSRFQTHVVAQEFRAAAGGFKSIGHGGLSLGGKNHGPISAGLISCSISIPGGTWDAKKVLGTATVYDDGSACFTVPARTPIFFQALDAKGQMVQSMRSWMTLQPGETASCVGCHERKNLAPPVPYSSRALAAGAETLDRKPFDGPPLGFSFAREIQPILDRHCAGCHHLDKDSPATKGTKSAFSLKWPASYIALADRKVCNWINAQSKPAMLPPYHNGVSQSRLIKILEGGKHYAAKLSEPEMARLITWIDVGVPRGVGLSADGRTLYVAERLAGTVAVIDTAKSAVTGRIPVGKWPEAIAVANKTKRLYVCNQDTHSVSVVDLAQGKTIKQITVVREPACAAVTPDEKYVVVTNFLPHGASTDPALSAVVSIIDGSKLEVASTVKLPPGSTAAHGACISPDGRWAYVVHQLARFTTPITQLERGWVNTYALSILDIANGTRLVTVLLDDLTRGAANPCAVVCSKDGRQLWISHAGVHEVSNVKIHLVHALLEGKVPAALASIRDGSLPDPQPEKGSRGLPAIPPEVMQKLTEPNIWVRIQKDRKQINVLENDLTALYLAGAIRRFPTGGNSPRGIALTSDGKQLLVANYYSGSVAVMDPGSGKLQGTISLGPQPEPNAARRGEMLFHDATFCFQSWHSCASCHHGGGRIDALRWDFMRDGIGNPKDTPSLVGMVKTPPFNRLATRKTARICTETGVLVSHRVEPTSREVDDLLAYLSSLRGEPSPHLDAEGKLTEAAARGKVLFEGKADCARCHPAPLFTNQKMYNVGVETPNDPKQHKGSYDTPSLIEAHRTAPYLHDGRALTLKDVLTKHDKLGRHGKAKGLNQSEIDDLVEYLRSL